MCSPRRARARPAEQLLRGAVPALDGEVGRLEERGVQGDAGVGHRPFETPPAVRRDVEVEVERGARADVRDVAVAEGDQMLGRELRDGHIVDGQGVERGARAADHDHGQTQIEQVPGLIVV